jgi:hypothetical protein
MSATKKAKTQVKQLAKSGDSKNATVLAKEVVRSNKQKDRLSVSKAQLGSINTHLVQQLGEYFSQIEAKISVLKCSSYVQDDWVVAKVDRNHEDFEFARQGAPNQLKHAQLEHGVDEGTYDVLVSICARADLVVGRGHG